MAYFTKSIKYVVEVLQDLALCDFGNVVHGLACIVPNSCILIGKTSQHRGDDDFEIARELLMRGQPHTEACRCCLGRRGGGGGK